MLQIESLSGVEQAANSSARRRRWEQTGELDRRAVGGMRLLHMEELSAGKPLKLRKWHLGPGARWID